MSRKKANARVLELIDHFGKKDNSFLSVEFFFYADRQNDASNVAIDLSRLGYCIHPVDEPKTHRDRWAIIGATPKISINEDAFNEWTDKMERLAEENNCRFDGWGILIDQENMEEK